MGPLVAVIYAILMVSGYGSQVYHTYKVKSVRDLRLTFFFSLLLAVGLRLATNGIIIMETSNVTAMAMGIAEFAVFGGLFTIVSQIIWYRFIKKKR